MMFSNKIWGNSSNRETKGSLRFLHSPL